MKKKITLRLKVSSIVGATLMLAGFFGLTAISQAVNLTGLQERAGDVNISRARKPSAKTTRHTADLHVKTGADVAAELHKLVKQNPVQSPYNKGLKQSGNFVTLLARHQSNTLTRDMLSKNADATRSATKEKVSPASATIPVDLRGSIIYSDDYDIYPGIYSIPASETDYAWFTMLAPDVKATFGGVEVGGTYYSAWQERILGYATYNHVDSWDSEDWTNIYSTDEAEVDMLASCNTYDRTTGTVYGSYCNGATQSYDFGTADYPTMSRTYIKALENPWHSIMCDAAGQLYAIDMNGWLLRVDKTTGNTEQIGFTGQVPEYLGGATIDPISGRCFWSLDGMYEVDLTSGAATKLYDYPYNEQIVGLYVAAPDVDAYAPSIAENLAAEFPNGALNGSLEFDLPGKFFGGSEATGSLHYKVTCDYEDLAEGDDNPGQHISIPYEAPVSGMYEFAVVISNDKGESPEVRYTVFIGCDRPSSTTATLTYSGGSMQITWDAVTTAANDGYLVPEEVTYDVTRYPDEVKVVENLSATTYTDNLPAADNIRVYYYTVTPKFRTEEGEPARTNAISVGNIIPPYTQSFEDETSIEMFNIFDGNGDGATWGYFNGRARSMFNYDLDADDWMITPAIELKKGNTYRISFVTNSASSMYKERLEVKWGRQSNPGSMTNELVPPTELLNSSKVTLSGFITPQEDGLYYVGFHAISDKDNAYIYVDDITVGEPISSKAPGEVTDLVLVPDYNGANSVEISFNAPAADFSGDPLESLSKVVVLREGQEVKTFDTVTPGQHISFTDETESADTYTYEIVAYNTDGMGKSVTSTIHVGMGAPVAPGNIRLGENQAPGNITISWDKPLQNIYGFDQNPDLIRYAIYDNDGPVVENHKETSFTFQAVEADRQKFVQYLVFATNDAGESYGLTEYVGVGKPYSLPYTDSFADCTIKQELAIGESINEGQWNVYVDDEIEGIYSSDADNGFLAMGGYGAGASSSVWTGKISLEGAQTPTLRFAAYNMSDSGAEDTNTLDVKVKDLGTGEWTTLRSITLKDLEKTGWNNIAVDLSEFKGKDVSVKFTATVNSHVYVLLDDIRLFDLLDHNLSAGAISAPAKVKCGESFPLECTVSNNGSERASGYIVHLYRNGEKVSSRRGSDIEAYKSRTVVIPQTLSVLDEAEQNYHFEIEYDPDLQTSDNISAPANIALRLPVYPTPTGLEGTEADGQFNLSWSAPDMDTTITEEITEDFEEADSWADEYGDWTFADLDMGGLGGIEGISLPGHDMGDTAGFFVMDASYSELNPTFAANSGNKYLAAVYLSDGSQNDDWAISPLLSGEAQTISFYAKSYGESYPESLQVLYSTESNDTEDFMDVAFEDLYVPSEWTLYTVQLPAGAKYFAIRCISYYCFLLLIDDVTFTPASAVSDLELLGYNLYRDGTKVNDSVIQTTAFSDPVSAAENVSYRVTAVYDKGESTPSNMLSMTSGIADVEEAEVEVIAGKGMITVKSPEGKALTLQRTDGIVVYSGLSKGTDRFSVTEGVYIVKVGSVTRKVIVR